jgi:hypothetical protein
METGHVLLGFVPYAGRYGYPQLPSTGMVTVTYYYRVTDRSIVVLVVCQL